MNPPAEAPKLPKLPFIVGDLVLVATAALIATRSASPITPGALFAITVCVGLGAVLLVIPFLADYARQQDAELTERQHQIAALARTTAESAEQIGIAAAGLNTLAGASKQNLDAIGQLPSKLQDRIDHLTQQVAGSALATHAAVKGDLAELAAAAEKITRTLAKLDTVAQAKTSALNSAENDLAATLARARDQMEALIAASSAAATRLAELPAMPPPVLVVNAQPPGAAPPEPVPEPVPAPVAPENPAPPSPPPPLAPAPEPSSEPESAPATAPVEAPAQPSVPPAPEPVVVSPEPVFAPVEPDPADVPVAEPEAPKPPRARKPKPLDDGFDLGLTPDASEAVESAVTSDGFTRLIATAYIGIGNKLFLRGEGPGLSWDKGVPLQFVSIGKWRWETPDAVAPIRARLYKNDQIECVGLGTLTLEPGRQHEVNAGF